MAYSQQNTSWSFICSISQLSTIYISSFNTTFNILSSQSFFTDCTIRVTAGSHHSRWNVSCVCLIPCRRSLEQLRAQKISADHAAEDCMELTINSSTTSLTFRKTTNIDLRTLSNSQLRWKHWNSSDILHNFSQAFSQFVSHYNVWVAVGTWDDLHFSNSIIFKFHKHYGIL